MRLISLEIENYRKIASAHLAPGRDDAREVEAGQLADDKAVHLVEAVEGERDVAAPVEVVYRVRHYRRVSAWRM